MPANPRRAFRRSRARHLGQVDELASEILARATTAIRGLDLTRVNWVAATILKNVERDVLRAHNRETSRQSVQDEFDTDLHGGIFEFSDPELDPQQLLAELTRLIGVDADLVLRVVIDGYMVRGGQAGGRYLEQIGKTDLVALTDAEWADFVEHLVTGYCDHLRELAADLSECPF